MIEVRYRETRDGRLYVIANDNYVGEIHRTARSLFRWTALAPGGAQLTSRARSKTEATEVLLERAGALDE